MFSQLCFINFFLTPCVGLYMYFKSKRYELNFSFKNVLIYAIFVSLNIPFTHIFLKILRSFGRVIPVESSVYTVLTIISSLVLYAVFYICSEYFNISLKVEKK